VWVIVHVVVVTVLAVFVGRAVRGRHGRWAASDDNGAGGDGALAPGGEVPADAGPEPPGA
jgi:hypothetical protein